MSATPFDTFSAARALEAAGVERAQAEAIASAIGHAGEYATTADIPNLASELARFKADMEARFASLEARLYRALWVQGGAIVTIVTALRLLD